VAIGSQSGYTGQGSNSVAIGFHSGSNGQNVYSVAIGSQSGYTGQGRNSVAIGSQSGYTGQGRNSVAIGYRSGCNGQGPNAVAIGFQAGVTNQPSSSMILNASGTEFSGYDSGAFYALPLRTADNFHNNLNVMFYDPVNNEIGYSTAGGSASDKTFVIDHPLDTEKHLVHACLEGPEAGVFYRGRGHIVNGVGVDIELPSYVDALAHDFSVHLTPIHPKATSICKRSLEVSEVTDGKFRVYGENGSFFWLVHGQRHAIEVEPLKNTHVVQGQGPYRWINPIGN
jgi:hypothetical protein